jgi:hypothetical protein
MTPVIAEHGGIRVMGVADWVQRAKPSKISVEMNVSLQ